MYARQDVGAPIARLEWRESGASPSMGTMPTQDPVRQANMRSRLRRLISRLATAMHADLIGEIRRQHKQLLERAAESAVAAPASAATAAPPAPKKKRPQLKGGLDF